MQKQLDRNPYVLQEDQTLLIGHVVGAKFHNFVEIFAGKKKLAYLLERILAKPKTNLTN